jgi:hypothetical protein
MTVQPRIYKNKIGSAENQEELDFFKAVNPKGVSFDKSVVYGKKRGRVYRVLLDSDDEGKTWKVSGALFKFESPVAVNVLDQEILPTPEGLRYKPIRQSRQDRAD